jgi:hypothetical protein
MGVKYLERKSRNQRTIGFGYLENLKEINKFHERTHKEVIGKKKSESKNHWFWVFGKPQRNQQVP